MMKKTKLTLLIVILLLFTQACSPDTEDTSPPAGQPDATVETPATEPPTEDTASSGSESYLPAMNLPEIEQFTPTVGVGIKPLFEWQAVDGAAWYALVLKNSEEKPYWAWMGKENSIYLGGVSEQPGDNIAGPRLEDGMQWAVVAYDSQGQIIAASSLRPISP